LPIVDTVNVELELPAGAVTVAGETARVKSLAGGGGGSDFGPAPQATKPDSKDPMLRISREFQKLTGCVLV
jgi:hypothetical protein